MKTTLESGLKVIDSAYEQQAQAFLDRFGIKFRATLSDSKVAPWATDRKPDGHHYRVSLWRHDWIRNRREKMRVVFDFFGSIADAEKGKHPTAYDVLACISGDTYCAETFEEWAGEFGYEADSIKALQTYRRCAAFAKRLNAFFTSEEIEALREIQ